jgi:hypothetical protein
MWWTEQDQGQKDKKQGGAKMRSLLLEMVEVDPAQSREVEQDLS